ncbi:MAG: response regulator [Leptolyngbyaceae cyanobacterium bins.59]|nr:response regulator [Leptolyngbyaceae cyanobacterium bins.59]
MQGKLNEIDIRSILQLIELGQRTGELFVEAYNFQGSGQVGVTPKEMRPPGGKNQKHQSWFVFFVNGQIIYATDTSSSLSRLRDYLRRYKVEAAPDQIQASSIAATNAPEYGYLWTLLEKHTLTPAQGRSIVQSMVHETLFDLLSLHQGAFIFETGPSLAPQLMTLEIDPLVAKIMKEVQEWKQFYPYIQSPEHCPVISDQARLREALPVNIVQHLGRLMDGRTSVRQIARYLHRDVLMVAKAIYPYVQQGLIQISPLPKESGAKDAPQELLDSNLQPWHPVQAPRIVCIDDGVTVCEAVELILSQHGYEASTVTDPLQAFRLLFQLKPDLILCDIAMPELDGYEICAMLRRSTLFRETPIVMLTGKDGFIDRVKAKMVGATDYLTKPFGENELLMLVEKYVGPGSTAKLEANHSSENIPPENTESEGRKAPDSASSVSIN